MKQAKILEEALEEVEHQAKATVIYKVELNKNGIITNEDTANKEIRGSGRI